MDMKDASGLVAAALYGIEYIDDITTPEAAAQRARAITGGRLFADPPADYLEAIDLVVASGEPPAAEQLTGEPFAPESVLLFLRHVGDELRTQVTPGGSPA